MNIPGAFLYYLILWPLSLFPLIILYRLSDIMFLLTYYIIPYRKKIVFQNLKNAFPEKSDQELKLLSKKFYRHFCDLIIESLKAFSIRDKVLKKHVGVVNNELLMKYYHEKRSLILMTSHYGNWEWGSLVVASHSQHKAAAIYLPLKNKFFNNIILRNRGRFGTELISVRQVARYFSEKAELYMCVFLGDQSPSNPRTAFWTSFLNQETAFLRGAELLAKDYNLPVIYGNIRKIARGKYEVVYELMCDDPSRTEDGEITKKYIQVAERSIREKPEYWLWSHRRWKHKQPS